MALWTVTDDALANATFTDPNLKDGDVIHLVGNPPTGYYTAPAGGYVITKSLEVYGDGPGLPGSNSGTNIRAQSDSDPIFKITHPVGADIYGVHLHDMRLYRATDPGRGTLGGHGVSCIATDHKISHLRLARLRIFNMAGDGIHLEGADESAKAVNLVRLENCDVSRCRGRGLFAKYVIVGYALGCSFDENHGSAAASHDTERSGVYVESSAGFRFIASEIAGNLDADDTTLDAEFNVQLRLKSTHAFDVIGCHFENFDHDGGATPARTCITVENCWGGQIMGCTFGGGGNNAASRGIYIRSASTGSVIGGNEWGNINKLIEIRTNDGNTGHVILPQAIRFSGTNTPGTISVPDEDGNGNFVYLPKTKATDPATLVMAGLLFPRLAGTGGIDSDYVRRGLALFNSMPGANRLSVYSGSTSDSASRGYGWQAMIPKVGTDVDLTNQSAAITTTALLASVPAGLYRVAVAQTVTTAGADVTLDTTIGWTGDGVSRSLKPAGTQMMNVTGMAAGVVVFQATDQTDITYATSLSGSAGSGKYALRIRLEAL